MTENVFVTYVIRFSKIKLSQATPYLQFAAMLCNSNSSDFGPMKSI